MEPYIVEAKVITPKITLDPQNNTYELCGESRPESVSDFYIPVLQWLKNFSEELKVLSDEEKKSKNMDVYFKLDYFNSSSAKYLYDIVKSLMDNFYVNNISVKVFWHYDAGDEDMLEAGEELSNMVKFPFEYIEQEASDD